MENAGRFYYQNMENVCLFYYLTSNTKNSMAYGKLFEPKTVDRSQKFLQFKDTKNFNKSTWDGIQLVGLFSNPNSIQRAILLNHCKFRIIDE